MVNPPPVAAERPADGVDQRSMSVFSVALAQDSSCGSMNPVVEDPASTPSSPRQTGGWRNILCCTANYEAPESRPWVAMHCATGLIIVHFAVSVSQSLLYTAQFVGVGNPPRLPNLLNVLAGNIQIVLSIIISIINFVLLPTVGAFCDYTKYRWHIGSIAFSTCVAMALASICASIEVSDRSRRCAMSVGGAD